MKKIIFLAVILAVGMVSCQNKQERIEEEQVEEKKVGTELRLFLEECLSKVPNAKDNKITMQELEDTITARMEKKIGDTLDIIYNYPVKIKGYNICDPIDYDIENYPEQPIVKNLGKYAVVFTNTYTRNLDSPDDFWVFFDIITFMKPEDVKKLKDNTNYKIQGKFKGFAKDLILPKEKGFFTGYPIVSKNESSTLHISLGSIMLEDVKIEPFEEDNM